MAEREGKYLAELLNKIGKVGGGHANVVGDLELGAPFVYKHLGSMATVGSYKALVDLRQSKVTIIKYTGLFVFFCFGMRNRTRQTNRKNLVSHI